MEMTVEVTETDVEEVTETDMEVVIDVTMEIETEITVDVAGKYITQIQLKVQFRPLTFLICIILKQGTTLFYF